MNFGHIRRTFKVDSTQVIGEHPAGTNDQITLPDFLLLPVVEAAFSVIKSKEESELPGSLRRISHFDMKALHNSTARNQILQSIQNNQSFLEAVEEELFKRVEVAVAFQQWNSQSMERIIKDAASRNDLPLLASVLWIKKPEQYSFALGQIVALSEINMMESERQDDIRAENIRITHLETSLEKEKSRTTLLSSEIEKLEEELRNERKNRRVNIQRQEAQIAALQKQIDSNDEVVERLKDAKERINQRLEREASRAHELESRLKLAQNESKTKSEKIAQLQDQLARALSSDMELTYEDLQKLILAQKEAEGISQTILNIMNKTRTMLSQSDDLSNAQVGAQSVTQEEKPKRKEVKIPAGLSAEAPAALRTVFAQEDLVVLIDGYNVSLNSFGTLPLELQRERTIACAASIESRFHPSCVVVFDGQSSTTRGRVQSKVHVVYSPSGITADDVIVERIRVTPPDRPIVVVTSDKNLSARVKGLGCLAISSASFVEVAK